MLTVEDLINKLLKMPQDLPVRVWDGVNESEVDIRDVEVVSTYEKEYPKVVLIQEGW